MQQAPDRQHPDDKHPGSPHSRRLPVQSIVLIAVFALAALLSLRSNQPPTPLGHDAPATAFSAARARDVLARVLGDGSAHPTGSAANAAVRDRIVAEFARIGVTTRVQRRFACGMSTCATVDNIIAHLPGASPENAVLLSAHYDSVAAGPGASDDGAGVAALIEAARALKAGPQLPRDVWLLANDGEELGLLGAEAFVQAPEFADIATVVNLEARGTTGASLLIETQPGNAAIIETITQALAKPGGTSLDYEIYKTLPNDTDFTVYKRAGLGGTNFAWAQGAARYHTPLDNLAHLDPGSLQHHGDNLLAMARALASAPTDLTSTHDAVFFTLPGDTMLSWPAPWNPALLLLGLVGWLLLAVRLVRTKQTRLLPLLGGGLVVIAGLVALALLGWALHALLAALGAMPAMWTAQQAWLIAAFVLLAVAFAGLLARPLARRPGIPALAIASLLPFALISTAAVLAMPGASFIGLLPLFAGVLAGHIWPRRPAMWAGIAAVVAVLLWFPYVIYSYSAIGHPGLSATTVLMGLVLLPLLPVLAGLGRRVTWLGALALLAMLVVATLAVVRPAFDANVPRPVNLVHAGNGDQTRVFLRAYSELPQGFLRDSGFAMSDQAPLPWFTQPRMARPGGPALTSPTLQVVSDRIHEGRRYLQVRLRSPRGAVRGRLLIPTALNPDSIRVQEQALAPVRREHSGQWRAITVAGMPAEGVLFEFAIDAGAPATLYGIDSSHGLPATLRDVVQARDQVAVPIHGGDINLSWTEVMLPAGDAQAQLRKPPSPQPSSPQAEEREEKRRKVRAKRAVAARSAPGKDPAVLPGQRHGRFHRPGGCSH